MASELKRSNYPAEYEPLTFLKNIASRIIGILVRCMKEYSRGGKAYESILVLSMREVSKGRKAKKKILKKQKSEEILVLWMKEH